MNERELKLLFCSALRSGHIKNNDLIQESAFGSCRKHIRAVLTS